MKILLGYEASRVGDAAVELATKRARQTNARVFVVTSLIGGDETSLEEIEQSKQALDRVRELMEEEGIANETHLLIRGRSAGEDVVGFADEVGADEIIIGVRRRSKVGKLLFGSTAQYIILNANCPVVTVK